MTYICVNCKEPIVRNPRGSDGWFHVVETKHGLRYYHKCDTNDYKKVAEPWLNTI